MTLYYTIIGIISFLLGVGGGYLIFNDNQADLSEIKNLCKDDKICVQYTACLIVNSRSVSGQNPRNCDIIAEAINYDIKQQILQRTYDYCAKLNDAKEGMICREFMRPK